MTVSNPINSNIFFPPPFFIEPTRVTDIDTSKIGKETIGHSVASSVANSMSPITIDFKNLNDLQEKNLSAFFDHFDEVKKTEISSPSLSLKTDSQSIDYIHFIWMENPMKKLHEETILSWKREFPSKQIILWVDKQSLESEKNLKFAESNNIKLINLDNIFPEDYTFGLDEFIKKEKDSLFPNWGAVSDMYRYLIMYYFAGTYSDCDCDLQKYKGTAFDYEKPLGFYKFPETFFDVFCNDRIMSKNIRNPFWKNVFEAIKINYSDIFRVNKIKSNQNNTFNICKCLATLERTGPGMLLHVIEEYKKSNPEVEISFKEYAKISSFSWLAKLNDEKVEKLVKEKDIEQKIIREIKNDLLEMNGRLDLKRYKKIIEKLDLEARERILNAILIEIKKNKDGSLKVESILLPKNIDEYKEIIRLIEKKGRKNQIVAIKHWILKKVIKQRNIPMFKQILQESPELLYSEGILNPDILESISKFNVNDLTSSIVKYNMGT